MSRTKKQKAASLHHPEIVRVMKRIGPIFPAVEEGWRPGMRGVPRTATHPPITDEYRRRRQRRRRIANASRRANR